MAGLFDAPLGPRARERRADRAIRFIKRGDGRFTVDAADEIAISVVLREGARLTLKQGGHTTTFVPRFAEHGVMVPGCATTVMITGAIWALQMRLAFADLRRAAEEDHGLDPDRIVLAPVIAGEDDGLMRSIRTGYEGGPLATDETLREVTAHLLRRGPQSLRDAQARGGLSPRRLRRVLDLVEEHVVQGPTLDQMAEQATLTPFHFAREFRRTVGCAPHAYLIRRRLARAAALLADVRLSIEEVAYRSGFTHASHLGHHLRRRYGVSCSSLRAMLTL